MPVATLKSWLVTRRPHGDRRYLVAFSGGLDSLVLLHAMAGLCKARRLDLIALHVDHALHDDSRTWAQECERQARALGAGFVAHRLDRVASGGGGVEAAAREARYRWFSDMVGAGDVLMTAHHRADQAETVLYNLFRGAGARGIAAMPVERKFFKGTLARPLLRLGRDAIRDYALEHGLVWLEDPSNRSLGFDRNFIRHRVMPLLMSRWPAVESGIARASVNAADEQRILERLADRGLAEARSVGAFNLLESAAVLDRRKLYELPIEECLNLVRRWIQTEGFMVPARERLLRMHADLVTADRSSGCFAWEGARIRRYRDALYLDSAMASMRREAVVWHPRAALPIPGAPLLLVARHVVGAGISEARLGDAFLTVDWKTAQHRIRVVRSGPGKSLRKVFQETAVPPWIREVLPRICLGGDLLAVPGVVENADYAADPGESGVRFQLVVAQSH